jgi:hypothetical protein
MRVHRLIGSFGIALGFVAAQAQAQSIERVAALDPTIAPAPTETAPAPATVSATPAAETAAPSSEADTTAVAPPAAVAAPVAPPPAPHTAPAPAIAPVTFGFDSRAKDAPGPKTSSLPIRSQRKLELLGDAGWNSLAGFGVMLTYNAHPHLAFDLAGGLSATGWKAGLRGRYNLLTGPFTPFVGAGLSMSSGLDGAELSRDRRRSRDDNFDDFDPKDTGRYDVKRSEFAQAVLGFEFIHRHGFTMQVAGGYSWLLNRNNFTFVEGRRDDHLASIFFGSGPVVSTAFGYAFD